MFFVEYKGLLAQKQKQPKKGGKSPIKNDQ